jgi:hypothetical protein
MYSFVHSKSQNRLRLEKAKAMVYIYTNNWFLFQRPSADLVCCYDDNIFLKDFNHDGGAFYNTINNNDNDDGD